jgi:hypothetical protein
VSKEAVVSIARLCAAVSELSSIVATLDAEALECSDALALVSAFVEGENLCAAGKALCAARAAGAGGHRRAGHADPASWLAALSGEPRGRAHDALQTASSLSDLPLLDKAVRAGQLSPTMARTVADAASKDPGSESSLLDTARTGSLRRLREEAERVKAAARSKEDDEARYEAIRKGRYLRTFTGSDGGFKGQFSLTPDAGAKVLSILQPASDFFFDEARREGRREPGEAHLADALVAVVTGEWPGTQSVGDVADAFGHAGGCVIGTGAGGVGGWDPGDTVDPSDFTDRGDIEDPLAEVDVRGAAGDSQRRDTVLAGSGWAGSGELADPTDLDRGTGGLRASPAYGLPPGPPALSEQDGGGGGVSPKSKKGRRAKPPGAVVICRVDLAALRRGEVLTGEMCEIPGVGPVPVSVARELFGDCFLKFVITSGVDIQAVLHYGRYPRAHQRTALQFRDPCCVVPGCGRTFGLQYDHTDPWSAGGATSLDNLARLCTPHHAMKTHRGYQLKGGPEHWEWVAPDSSARESGGEGEIECNRKPEREPVRKPEPRARAQAQAQART